MGKQPKRLVPKSYINERIAEISINCVLKWQSPVGGNRNICSLDEYEEELRKEFIDKQARARHDKVEQARIQPEVKIIINRYKEEIVKKKQRNKNKYTKAHREMALQLADNKCEKCGDSDYLHVHHMKYKSKGGTDDISNLIILCELCHIKEHEGEPVHNLMLSRYRKRLAKSSRIL